MKSSTVIVALAALFWIQVPMSHSTATAAPMQSNDDLPQTVAEESDFTATSTSAEVAQFIEWCDEHAEHVRRVTFGETVEGRDMIAAIVSTKPYELGQQDDRAIALVIGNIHSGECAGKEALLMLLRQLTHHPEHPWLENMVVILVPNYSADANDRMGKYNRPGQHGPEQGMGQRPNAQGLDLNRDFVKLESPEARALIGLIDQVDPHLFIDCHTTNGSRHQYALTYDVPHNPAAAAPVREYLRSKMMPAVTRNLEDAGTLTFYYGNFDRAHTKWTTYGHEPRYSTEYVGLRGRLAILSEAYSYISYRDRIFATRDFVSECLDHLHQNAETVQKLLQQVDSEWKQTVSREPQRISLSLAARVVPFPEKYVVKGFQNDEPKDYEVDFVGLYEPTRTTSVPYAYVIPQQWARPVDRLRMHGIDVRQLAADVELSVQQDTITAMNRAERAFQKHRMVQCETSREPVKYQAKQGDYVVYVDQPLGRLAVYLLEPTSDDGLVFWNFFDDALEMGATCPVVRVPDPIELQTREVTKVEPTGRIREALIDGPNKLLPQVKSPYWTPDGKLAIEDGGRLRIVDPVSLSIDSPEAGFDRSELEDQLLDAGFTPDQAVELAAADPLFSAQRSWAAYVDGSMAAVVHAESGKCWRLGDGSAEVELVRFAVNEAYVAWYDGALRFLRLDDGRVTQLQSDSDDILIGKLDWVYQEELYGRGNFQGYWLEPAEPGATQHVAFFKLDESKVKKFPIVDHLPVVNELDMMSYPKAGDPNPGVALGIVPVDRPSEISWVDLSSFGDEILISNVGWMPDGQTLTFQVQDREQTWLDLCAVTVGASEPTVLFRDETPAWIESPGQPIWLEGGDFLWLSPRNGYRHLYRYGRDGELKSQLTSGDWEIRSVLGLRPAADGKPAAVFFTAAHPNPTQMHLWAVEVESGQLHQITREPGTHDVKFHPDWTFFLDAYSRVHRPTEHRLYDADGKLVHKLLVRSDDRFEYLAVKEPTFTKVDPESEQPMDGMLILPPDFDPSKKYPVLVHIYAGPQAPRVRDRFGGAWYLWHQMLAQNGLVIWMCDNRSASFRSSRNAWPIHRNLGANELRDIETGLDWLNEQPWVDADRIGIWGWSYGGYMTAYTLTHSDRFRMGISGAPVTDWKNYDSIYTERLMGTPQNNPDGYQATSVVRAADRLSGALLVIHGSVDENVHLSNTLQFVYELQQHDIPFEMMIYPKNRHAIRDPQQAKHLREMMFRFVMDHLKK